MIEITSCEPQFKQHVEILGLQSEGGLIWTDEVLHGKDGIFYSARQTNRPSNDRGVKAGSMSHATASELYMLWITAHLRENVPFTVFALSCGAMDK